MAEPALDQQKAAGRRGIQNVQKVEREAAEDTYPQPHTIGRHFREEQSVQARAAKRRMGRFEKQDSNRNQRSTALAENQAIDRKQFIPKRGSIAESSGALKKMKGFGKWMGLGIALFITTLQVFSAFVSAVAFGLYIIYQTAIEELGLLGKAVSAAVDTLTSTVNSISNLFMGTDVVLSLDMMAWIFLIISASLSIGMFLGFWVWYKIIGMRPSGTIVSSWMSLGCLSLSLMPFLNIFPWILVWVIYTMLFLRR